MNFQVPQFIEIEDKPIGPFTFKQFIYLAGGGGICFVLWVYMPLRFLAVLFIIPVGALALALAFYKINNRPFILTMEAALKYWASKKLYTWKKTANKIEPNNFDSLIAPKNSAIDIPRLSQSKLSDLAWSLDIQEKVK
jgi:hypothetical protein